MLSEIVNGRRKTELAELAAIGKNRHGSIDVGPPFSKSIAAHPERTVRAQSSEAPGAGFWFRYVGMLKLAR